MLSLGNTFAALQQQPRTVQAVNNDGTVQWHPSLRICMLPACPMLQEVVNQQRQHSQTLPLWLKCAL